MSPDMTTYAMDDQQLHDYRRELSPIKETVSPVKEETGLIENEKYQKAIFDDARNSERITQEMAAGPSNISKLIEEEPKLSDTELLQAVGKELPEINIDTSSDESRDHYLPESEVTHEEVKSGFSQLFESIRSKFKSDSPNISQVGLQPSRSDITPTSTPKIKNF